MVRKWQFVIKIFLGPDTKNFLAGKKLGFLCTFEVIGGGGNNFIPLFELIICVR